MFSQETKSRFPEFAVRKAMGLFREKTAVGVAPQHLYLRAK
jgi:hypothetical protein